MLASIGLGGEPVNPDTPFATLIGDDDDPRFLAGSVQPMSLRHVVMMLLKALPSTERTFIGELLMLSVGGESDVADADSVGSADQQQAALNLLVRMPSAALDSCPNAPLFYIHLEASQRSIARDVADQVRRWKKCRGIREKRVHIEKHSKYLEIWDIREGWNSNSYQLSKEKTFAVIAKGLRVSVSTVFKRYKSAFKMVTGQEFTPARWWKLLAPLKYSEIFGDPAAVHSARVRHRLRSASRRPIPDSVVSPVTVETRSAGVVEATAATLDDFDSIDLRMDLKDLIARGFSDDEIARRLEFRDSKLVSHIRSRMNEFSRD
jgi:hypothetical protein